MASASAVIMHFTDLVLGLETIQRNIMSDAKTNWLGLESKICVVTGAAGGIGFNVAQTLAQAGARVAILDLNASGSVQAAEKIREATGVQTLGLGCDTTRPESVQTAAQEIAKTLGACDVLVNNAGVLRPAALADITLEQWNMVMAVDVTGYLICSQVFGREMVKRGSGVLVHVASIAAHFPQPWSGAYSPAKSAAAMLSKQLAAEWGPYGIRSNAVCPGMIRTPLSAKFYEDPKTEEGRKAMTASRRIGEPQDIANAVAFLASPRSSYVNATEIVVDGGIESMLMDLIPRPGFEREGSK